MFFRQCLMGFLVALSFSGSAHAQSEEQERTFIQFLRNADTQSVSFYVSSGVISAESGLERIFGRFIEEWAPNAFRRPERHPESAAYLQQVYQLLSSIRPLDLSQPVYVCPSTRQQGCYLTETVAQYAPVQMLLWMVNVGVPINRTGPQVEPFEGFMMARLGKGVAPSEFMQLANAGMALGDEFYNPRSGSAALRFINNSRVAFQGLTLYEMLLYLIVSDQDPQGRDVKCAFADSIRQQSTVQFDPASFLYVHGRNYFSYDRRLATGNRLAEFSPACVMFFENLIMSGVADARAVFEAATAAGDIQTAQRMNQFIQGAGQ